MSDDERAALVAEQLRSLDGLPGDARYWVLEAADLLEADGKLIALAEKTIASVKEWRENEYHEMHASGVGEFCTGCEMTNDLGARLAEYDAAKEGL